MGQYNSSLTRVKPVFDALQARDSTGATWLPELWHLAAATRGEQAAAPPTAFGTLLPGKVYERTLPPSTAFLRWAIENPQLLTALPAPNYGATGELAMARRADLFGADQAKREEATRLALSELQRVGGGKGSGQQWWAFEGFTHADACFETSECLVLIEGKRTEAVSSSTRWFAQRNQLWRNVEVAQELAGQRSFGVIVAVESTAEGEKAIREALTGLESSYPHLDNDQRGELARHLLGSVVWRDLVMRFELPEAVLRESC